MARFRLSGPASADISSILRRSESQHGRDTRIQYRGLLAAALRRIAAEPAGPFTSDRSDVLVGSRSFHIRHSRHESREAQVLDPVHVIFYRGLEPGLVEILRVLHDRMEPRRPVGAANKDSETSSN
jgi:toxin ParE1/3/4